MFFLTGCIRRLKKKKKKKNVVSGEQGEDSNRKCSGYG